MPASFASVIFAACIGSLYFLDRRGIGRVSKALWIPTAWLAIAGSRPVSAWLQMSPTAGRDSIYLEGSPIDRAVFTVLETLAVLVLIDRRRLISPILRRNWPILAFFLYAALSVFWSDFPFVTFKRWIKGTGDLLMVLILLTEPNVAYSLKRLGTRIAFVFMPLSILFIKYYPQLGRGQNNSWAFEAVGVATQKNGLGQLCVFVGIVILWRFHSLYSDRMDPDRGRRLWALGVVLAMIIWLLWISASTTSICSFTLAGSLMLMSTRLGVRRRPVYLHLAIVLTIGFTVSLLVVPSLGAGAIVGALGKSATLTGRTDVWPMLLSIPNNPWVGAGYESFWLGQRLMQAWELMPNFHINEAHNGYVEMFLNLGWAGVLLLGLLIATGYRNVTGALRNDHNTGSVRIALFVAPVISALSEAVFRMVALTWVTFLLAIAVTLWTPKRRASAVVSSGDYPLASGQEPDAAQRAAARP